MCERAADACLRNHDATSAHNLPVRAIVLEPVHIHKSANNELNSGSIAMPEQIFDASELAVSRASAWQSRARPRWVGDESTVINGSASVRIGLACENLRAPCLSSWRAWRRWQLKRLQGVARSGHRHTFPFGRPAPPSADLPRRAGALHRQHIPCAAAVSRNFRPIATAHVRAAEFNRGDFRFAARECQEASVTKSITCFGAHRA